MILNGEEVSEETIKEETFEYVRKLAWLREEERSLREERTRLASEPALQRDAELAKQISGIKKYIEEATMQVRLAAINYAQVTGLRKTEAFEVKENTVIEYDTPTAVKWCLEFSPVSLEPNLSAIKDAPAEVKVKLAKWMGDNCPELLTVNGGFLDVAKGSPILTVRKEPKTSIASDLSKFMTE